MNNIEKLEIVINSNEYFHHFVTILMREKRMGDSNFEDDLDEDIDNTFKRKELADYYRNNNMLPLSYSPMVNSYLLKEKLIKILNKRKRKSKITKIFN